MEKKEKPATKICKYCQSEIPGGAKVCPSCGKKVKGGPAKWIVLGIAAVLLLAVLIGGDGDGGDEGTKKVGEVGPSAGTSGSVSSGASGSSAPQTDVKTVYKVGDILQDGDMKIVYTASGEYKEDNEFLQADEGYKYIYLSFAFENTSDKDNASVSFYSFSCFADGYAAEMHYAGDDDLSASLSPGRFTSGSVYFMVPEDASDIEIEYETNVFTSEKINFVYDGEQDSGYVQQKDITPSENACHIGDIVEIRKLRVSYLSCEDDKSDNMFIKPKEGNKYITASFEFENLGDSDQFVSSLDFNCYADGASCNSAHFRDDSLSATMSAGRKAKGTVTFEVPRDAVAVEIEFSPNIWSDERAVFAAN